VKELKKNGGVFVEAPVLGNTTVAQKAGLNVMVGCKNQADFENLTPIFSCLGTPRYFGQIGTATAAKLSFNFMLASTLVTFSESYAYLEKKGVNLDSFLTVLTNGPLNLAGGYYPVWSGKFKNRSYDPIAFTAAGIEKDVRLAVNQFQQAGIHTAAAEGVYKQIKDAVEIHHVQDKDFSAVFEAAMNPKKS